MCEYVQNNVFFMFPFLQFYLFGFIHASIKKQRLKTGLWLNFKLLNNNNNNNVSTFEIFCIFMTTYKAFYYKYLNSVHSIIYASIV